MRPKLPFGIAQIGKAFRNEITPRNFLFRVREFEQMEIEYFVEPEKVNDHFEYWRGEVREWLTGIGIDSTKIFEHEIETEDLAHYSDRTIDFEFDFPFGRKELYGLVNRTNYDLVKHMDASGTSLEYVDAEGNKTIPYIIEPSVGVGRVVLALLTSVYAEEKGEGEEEGRIVLRLPPALAPYKVAVSPLLKNKPELVDKARHIYRMLKDEFGAVIWDDNGNIGKRYRRQDEIGTPLCIVIDFETIEKREGVTVRHRDSMQQERVSEDELVAYIRERLM
jgi:glycyl-tRNA synthetase